ncbi:MAG: aminoglycoside phosphotransferase family protein [Bdellovibrionales bacterium]
MNELERESMETQTYLKFLENHLGEGFKLYPLAGDASMRRYYRVVQQDKSYVLMQWEAFNDIESYPFINVTRHFANNNVNVPEILDVDAGQGLLLLEDLGDLTLERKFWESQEPNSYMGFYRDTIDQLCNIHYLCTNDRSHDKLAFKNSFDTDKLLWELNYSRKNLLEGMLNLNFTQAQSKTLDDTFLQISQRLAEEDKFICHRDFHSRNVMIKLGEVKVIDYQDARLGPIQYDLVSLLRDSYVDLPRNIEKELLNYYLQKRKEFVTKPINQDHFLETYELQSIQRCFKACGSFASFYVQRQDTRYLKYLNNTLQQVLKCLHNFPEFSEFARLMIDKGVFNKDFDKK